MVTFPMASFKDNSLPSGVGPEKSGAVAPIAVLLPFSSLALAASKLFKMFLAGSVSFISGVRASYIFCASSLSIILVPIPFSINKAEISPFGLFLMKFNSKFLNSS